MPHFTIRLIGPTATGSRISGPLLRDLLAMVSEGSRRALRMRVEGRSTAGGRIPDRLEPATEFDFVGLSEGSCVVGLEAPTLAQAAAETFGQGNLFLDNARTSVGLWRESLADALIGKADSDLFDGSMLAEFKKSLGRVFSHAVDSFEIRNGKDADPPLIVRREGIEKIDELRKQTPSPRRIRIAGKLDALEHSDHRLTLVLAGGAKVPCWVGQVEEDRLRRLMGKGRGHLGHCRVPPLGKGLASRGRCHHPGECLRSGHLVVRARAVRGRYRSQGAPKTARAAYRRECGLRPVARGRVGRGDCRLS